MDNKQWKLSCYSNYSKWQQSPSYLLPHLHSLSPSAVFPYRLYKPTCHSDLHSTEICSLLWHYCTGLFTFWSAFHLLVCPAWLSPAPLCSVKGRQLNCSLDLVTLYICFFSSTSATELPSSSAPNWITACHISEIS